MSQVDKQAGQRPQNTRLSDALTSALGFEGDQDLRDLTIAYAEVMALPDAAKTAFDSLEGDFDPTVHLKWYGPVTTAINSTPVNGTLQKWKKSITEGVLQSLQGLADLLSALAPEPVIDTNQIKQISDMCDSLLESVTTADELAPDVRSFLVDHLEAIASAIRHYRIHGTVDLQREFDRTIGDIVRQRSWVEKFTSNTSVREFFKLLGWINLALNFGGTVFDVLPWDPTPELPTSISDGSINAPAVDE